MFISGPRASSLGSEQGTTNNALMKGMGGDHITSSAVFEISGSVGIGTSSPSAILHVSGTTGGLFEVDGAAAINALFVSASGRVGIGTTNPQQILNVYSPASSDQSYLIMAQTSGAAALFTARTSVTSTYFGTENSSAGSTINGTLANASFFANQSATALQLGTNNNIRLTITNSGSVGIGTTSPEGVLTIQGTSAQPPTSGTTANSLLQLVGSLNNQLNIGSNTVAGDYGSYIQSSDNNLAVPYPLNLQPNGGNVGIGTSTPSTKVHIYESATSSTAYLTIQNNRARNAAVQTTTTSGSFIAGTSIGTDTFNYQIYDGVAGSARLTISSTGAATFSSTIYTPNFISSDTEFRLGAAFARVATLDAGGGFGGGYNLNWNNGSPIHNSTGTISGYGYANDGSVRFYANTSNAANTSALLRFNIGSDGSIAMGNFSPSGTPTSDYRSFEIGRQGNTITGAPWKSNLYLSTNATITAGSTAFTYRNSGAVASFFGLEGGEMLFSNAPSGTAGNTVSFTERMRINSDGRVIAPFGYQSFKGSISLTAGQTAAIYTMPQASAADGVYYVYCRLNGGAAIYMASAIVTALAANNELFISNTRTGANVGLTVSGRDIRITNGGFGTFTWQWSIIFQPVD
jgi:hypothetical protein